MIAAQWVRLDRTRARLLAAIGAVFFAAVIAVAEKHPVTVLGLLLIACLAIAVVRFPMPAMAALLFLQPFHTAIVVGLANRAHEPIGPLRYWEDVLVVALFLRGLWERVRRDRAFPIDNAGDNFMMLYIAVYAALALASPARATVGEALVLYVEGPVLFLAIRFLRPNRRQAWMCAIALIAAATIIGGFAVFEWFGPHEGFLRWYGVDASQVKYSASQKPYRSASFLIDPLILAFYLAAATAFTSAIGVIRSRWRPIALACFGTAAGGLICTVTRSGYIGGGFGVLLVLLIAIRNPRVRLGLVGITLLVVGSLSLHFVENGTLTRGEGDTAHKNALVRDFDLVAARPFGYGLGTTDRFRFATKGPGQLGATEDTYMSRALEGGIQGLLLYLVALFVLIARLRSLRARALRARDGQLACVAVGAMALVVAVVLAGIFLGVLERVVEIVLWGVPALALTWPIAGAGEAPSLPGARVSAGERA